jgi:hypothetical protein
MHFTDKYDRFGSNDDAFNKTRGIGVASRLLLD